jgi:predicted peptidase
MMAARPIFLVTALFAVACGGGAGPTASSPAYASSVSLALRPEGTVEGAPQGYVEYLPPSYQDAAVSPLLVFLHSLELNGGGTEAALEVFTERNLTGLISRDRWPADRPFIVLAPQHDGAGHPACPTVAEVDAFLAFALAHYKVDPTRVYLTGTSCGALAGWDYLGEHTNEVVAAAVMIAGDGRTAFRETGCDLGRVSIWAFHGEFDRTVVPAGSVDPINALGACTDPQPVDVRVTIIPEGGHEIWDSVYSGDTGDDVYGWMLSHQKTP